MEDIHQHFIKAAIDLANENAINGNGGPFGALIVKDGKIVGKGTNSVTTSNDPTAHAEVNAIRDACKNLNTYQLDNCIIYTSCEPCPMCLGAIYWARPKTVYYAADQHDAAKAGFDDSFIYREINLDPHKRSIPSLRLNVDSSFKPFQSWIDKENKIEY